MGGSSMTTQTPFITRYSMPIQWRTTPTTPASGFDWTSPKTRHGLKEQMDLADQFIAEFCTLDPDEVPQIPSQGCSTTTSSKFSTLNTPHATSLTSPSIDLPTRDSEPMCDDSESYTTSRTLCSPPSNALTTRSGPIKRKWYSSPASSSKPGQHHVSALTSLGTLKQPTTLLRIAVTRHRHLLPTAYPQSLLAKDLAMGSLPLPWGSTIELGDFGPTTTTVSSATNSKTTPVVVPTNVATVDTTMTMTCAKNHTFVAHGTTATSHGPTRAMALSAQLPSLERWRTGWTWTATNSGQKVATLLERCVGTPP